MKHPRSWLLSLLVGATAHRLGWRVCESDRRGAESRRGISARFGLHLWQKCTSVGLVSFWGGGCKVVALSRGGGRTPLSRSWERC